MYHKSIENDRYDSVSHQIAANWYFRIRLLIIISIFLSSSSSSDEP